jgi:hypothetical protein
MDNGDKATIVGALAGIAVWWYFKGRHKYGMKGMR